MILYYTLIGDVILSFRSKAKRDRYVTTLLTERYPYCGLSDYAAGGSQWLAALARLCDEMSNESPPLNVSLSEGTLI